MSRILVVDDNAENRYSLRLILTGFEVSEAASGQEAIRMAREERPDCILLDVQMPVMDGFDVCRRLRAAEETRAVPIILVTAHNKDVESVVAGLAAGGDDYVTKPFAPQELLARVRAMLRVRELQEQLESLNRGLEQKVKQRTEELRQIYATVPVGIYTLDGHGRITSANRHLEKMLGYESEELVGIRTIGDLFAPGYDALYWLERCRREGRAGHESVVVARDGTPIPVHDERVVNHDEFGEPAGFTGYLQDLRREQRIRQLLADQEKQAGVGRLAAGIVHEIINPLAGVQLYVDALLRRPTGPGEPVPTAEDHRRALQVVADAVQRSTELIEKIRGFTRAAVRPVTAVDLHALLTDLQTLMNRDLQSRQIRMEVIGPSCVVRADAGALAQVFMNLLTNARDAIEPMPVLDGVRGVIRVEVDAEDSTARVRFSDTGVGIPPHELGRIFEFLYTTKGEAGTGYGLTITKDIVESHGGTISVQSEPGRGTTFTILLPRSASGTVVA